MSPESSGADYLRRLERDEECGLATSAEPVTALSATPPVETERRRSPRYKCEGSAEFRVGARTYAPGEGSRPESEWLLPGDDGHVPRSGQSWTWGWSCMDCEQKLDGFGYDERLWLFI